MISLDKIKDHLVPIDQHIRRWMFEDDNGHLADEFKDQIWGLTSTASEDLWEYEHNTRIFNDYPNLTKFFKTVETINISTKSNSEIKQWLHERGVKYSTNVFNIQQPNAGFMLTWKMVIKHHEMLFSSDTTIWDLSLNWGLACHHDGLCIFGRDRIYDNTEEQIMLTKLTKEFNK